MFYLVIYIYELIHILLYLLYNLKRRGKYLILTTFKINWILIFGANYIARYIGRRYLFRKNKLIKYYAKILVLYICIEVYGWID